ncbi:MAG: hypothetical protein ACM3JB_20850 [Acidobacteriaceae bacterium]
MKSELIRPTAATYIWRRATEILAFPMGYLELKSGSDWPLLELMLLNSIIWSALLTALVLLLYDQMRRVGREPGAPGSRVI